MNIKTKAVKVFVMDCKLSFFDSFAFTAVLGSIQNIQDQAFQVYLQRRKTGACFRTGFICSALQVDGVIYSRIEKEDGRIEWKKYEGLGY